MLKFFTELSIHFYLFTQNAINCTGALFENNPVIFKQYSIFLKKKIEKKLKKQSTCFLFMDVYQFILEN